MSQTETQLKIVAAKCITKYDFLTTHPLLTQDEKNRVQSTANAVQKTSGIEEFTMLDQFLSDCLLIVKMRQESESMDIQSKMLSRMSEHCDFMDKLSRRMSEHCDSMDNLSRRMG